MRPGFRTLILALGVSSGLAVAQTPQAAPALDSAAVWSIAQGIVKGLSQDLGADITNGSRGAWTVSVADSANPAWSRLQRGLRSVLRPSRDTMRVGTTIRHLRIGAPEQHGDTAVVPMVIDRSWQHHANCRISSDTELQVSSVWDGRHWSPGAARILIYGDPGECPPKSPATGR